MLLEAGDGWRERGSLDGIRARFGRAYRARLRWRLPACRAAAGLMMRPGLLGLVWPMLSAPVVGEALIRPWYALTGKPLRVAAALEA
jgi:hypothetical protein